MKKVYEKRSLMSVAVKLYLLLSREKKNTATMNNAAKYIEKQSKMGLKEKMYSDFTKENINNTVIYSFNGTLKENKGNVILYVHGGNFVDHANYYQIKMAKKIALKTNSTLIFLVYDLLPNGNSSKLLSLVDNVYRSIIETNPLKIILLGDSAGGGTVLSYAMVVRDKKLTKPNHIVMISPWLDLSMSNPEIKEYAKRDAMNSFEGIKYEGKIWAGSQDLCDPKVSPIYGNFEDLGEITILYGGREILTPDCRKFCKLLENKKIDFNEIVYLKEGHDFVAYPTKEGKKAIEDIIDIINK